MKLISSSRACLQSRIACSGAIISLLIHLWTSRFPAPETPDGTVVNGLPTMVRILLRATVFFLNITLLATCSPQQASRAIPKDNDNHIQESASEYGVRQEKQNAKVTNFVDNEDEYLIYLALINKYILSKRPGMIVVNEHTSPSTFTRESTGDSVLTGLPDGSRFPKECLEDFRTKNAFRWRLLKNKLSSKEYILAGNQLEDIDKDMRAGEDGWKNFYLRYPNTQGIVSFSRAGMNKRKTLAVVSFSHRFSAEGGYEMFILLRKQQDKNWRIIKHTILLTS